MRNWSMPAVLDGDADIEKLGTSFEEFDFSDMDSKLESRICAVFGVSPILLNLPGGLERSTFSNYEQALRTFWTNVLIPQMEDILDVIQNQILSEFDATGEWDYSRIMVLQNDFQGMLDVLLKACQNGIITVNEFRQYLDLEGFEQDERLSPMLKQMGLESISNTNPEETKKASKSNLEPLKPSEEELNAYIRKAQDLIAEPLEQFWQEELPKTERNFLQWTRKVETP
jgi:Phage-related protein